MTYTSKLLTEFVGTFLFLSVIALSGPIGPLAPLAIGSALMVMVYMGGHISGGHYNPAVSWGVFLRRKIGFGSLIGYWIMQLLGGALAFVFGYLVSGHSTLVQPDPKVSLSSAFAVETVFTMALVLVVLNVAATKATQGNSFYGLAIGFTIVIAAFAGGPISGGEFNPAVGIGAAVGGAFSSAVGAGATAGGIATTIETTLRQFISGQYLWIYIAGPLLGAITAAVIHGIQTGGENKLVE